MNFIADQSSQSIVASSNIPLFGTANYIVYSNTLAPYSTCNVSSNITSNVGSNLFLLKTGDTLSGILTNNGTINGNGNINLSGLASSTIISCNLISSNYYNSNLLTTSNINVTGTGTTSILTTGGITATDLALGSTGDITTVRNITSTGLITTSGNITATGSGSSITASNLIANFNLSVNSNITTSNLIATSIFYNGTQLSTTLSSYITSTILNTCNYLTSASLGSSYLQTSGGTMTGSITFTTTTGQNPIYIYSTVSNANNCIHFQNSSYNAYIGFGGTSFGGYYQNNLFLESTTNSIIFNTGSNNTSSNPRMIINSSGNVGIGMSNPSTKLNVSGVAYFTSSAGAGVPSGGAIGTDGLSIMIYGGASSSQCMGFGYANYQLWYNVPTTNYHNFYVAGTSVLQINSSGSTITGTLNATTIQENGTALTSKYLTLSGGTLTGSLNINSTNGGLFLQNTSGGAFGYASVSGNYSTSANAGDVVLRGAGNNLILQSGSSTGHLFINSSGNVGIGTTPSFTIALTVNGNILSSNIINNNTIYTSTALAIGTTGGSNLFPYNFNVNGTSYMNGNVGIGTTPSSTIALTVNGALNIISNPTNPGNNTSASFWNQAGIGPTISGLNLSVQTNGINEAMRIDSSGNTYFNGCVGIGTNNINYSYQLQLQYNATYTTQLRCEGGSGTIPLSIGGSGNVYVDAPGNVGGRFTILNDGNVGIGTSNPLTFLDVRGVLYLGGNSGVGTPASNWGNAGTRIVFWNDSTDVSYSMGINGATLWYAVPSGTNHIFYVGTTSIATINGSGLSVSGTLTTPQFYTSSTNNIISKVITIYPTNTSGGPYGNGYWLINVSNYTSQSGFSYLFLNISVPVVPIYWQGRVVISSGGSMSTYADIGYNVQLSFSSGNIQISSPSGASFSLALYYRIMG